MAWRRHHRISARPYCWSVRENQRRCPCGVQRHCGRAVCPNSTTFTYAPATAPGGAATTQGTIGAVTLSDITLPVKVLAIESGNSKTVSYDSATGFLTWNNTDSCALVLL
jgi:hypothetical protein